MKKILIVLLVLIMCPMIINAKEEEKKEEEEKTCDYKAQQGLSVLANKVDYDLVYNNSEGTFTVNLYNVVDGMYASYNSKAYMSSVYPDGVIQFKDIEQGTIMDFTMYASGTKCKNSLITLTVNVPFYNTYYKAPECEGYETLNVCSSKFLNYKINEKLFKETIENYNLKKNYKIEDTNKGDETFVELVVSFAKSWGLKILLIVVSAGLAFLIFNSKFRKIKHRI